MSQITHWQVVQICFLVDVLIHVKLDTRKGAQHAIPFKSEFKNWDKKGVWSRSSALLGLAAKLSTKEISSRLASLGDSSSLKKLQTQMEQARIMIEALGSMKGAAMKVGQMMSIEAADYLAPEVVEILSKLQDQTAFLDFEKVQKILVNELGDRAKEFSSLSQAPIAAASIGQVHLAKLGDKKVALKVQFPHVADCIDADIAILKKMIQSLMFVSGRQGDIEPIFAELSTVFKDEVDYKKEAAHTLKYKEICASRSAYIVPEVFDSHSSSKVLTLSYESGLRFNDFIKRDPSAELKKLYADLFLDLFIREFFEHGFVQSDPNFANFLFRPESEELVVLDFGAMRSYSPDFRRDYKKLLLALRDAPDTEILEQSIALDFIKSAESKECHNAFVHMLKVSVRPFEVQGAFPFADLDYVGDVRNATFAFLKTVKHSTPPHQLLFLHRKLGGIFHLLKALKVELELKPYWERIVALA